MTTLKLCYWILALLLTLCCGHCRGASDSYINLQARVRLLGPLENCQVSFSWGRNDRGQVSETDSDGNVNVSSLGAQQELYRVQVQEYNATGRCIDTVAREIPNRAYLRFQLTALAQPNTIANVGVASFAALAYFDRVLSGQQKQQTYRQGSASVPATVRQIMTDLYGNLGVNLTTRGLDPLTMDPLALLSSASRYERAAAVAILAAEVELVSIVNMGAQMASSTEGRNAVAACLAVAFVQLLKRPAAGIPLRGYTSRYSVDMVRGMYRAAAVCAGVGGLNVDVLATIAAGSAQFAEALKQFALWDPTGLDTVNALVALSKLVLDQITTAETLRSFPGLGTERAATERYSLSKLPTALDSTGLDINGVYTVLGLPHSDMPMKAYGAAHVIGPLGGCRGGSTDLHRNVTLYFTTRRSGAFEVGIAGSSAEFLRKEGVVSVSASSGCRDVLTSLPLPFTVSNLAPIMPKLSVSPVAMLAQAFYRREAVDRLVAPSLEHQKLAFKAMGLDLAAYNAFMVKPPEYYDKNPGYSPDCVPYYDVFSNRWSCLSGKDPQPFDVRHPRMGSVVAANAQMVGLVVTANALFARDCSAVYGFGKGSDLDDFLAALTMYAAAQQATNTPSGTLSLANRRQLTSILTFVAAACTPAGFSYLPSGSQVTGAMTGSQRQLAELSRQERGQMEGRPSGVVGDVGERQQPNLRLVGELFLRGILGLRALAIAAGKQGLAETQGPRTDARRRVLQRQHKPADAAQVIDTVSRILSGINAKLVSVQQSSIDAVSSGSGADLVALVAKAAKLGYILQQAWYNELSNVISSTSSTALTSSLKILEAQFQNVDTMMQMAPPGIDMSVSCMAQGSDGLCSSPPPPWRNPYSGSGDTRRRTSPNTMPLAVGLAFGGIVLIALVMGVACAKRRRDMARRSQPPPPQFSDITIELPEAAPLPAQGQPVQPPVTMSQAEYDALPDWMKQRHSPMVQAEVLGVPVMPGNYGSPVLGMDIYGLGPSLATGVAVTDMTVTEATGDHNAATEQGSLRPSTRPGAQSTASQIGVSGAFEASSAPAATPDTAGPDGAS